jgi:hypothetical protein
MADSSATGAPALSTNIASGKFDDEKAPASVPPTKQKVEEEEEEDEDIDALIEDLESQDGHVFDEEEEENAGPGAGRVIPEDMLQTDTRSGLTNEEVLQRRKKYGLNQMKEEKENMILKFLSYFVGPIQFVMEAAAVCTYHHSFETIGVAAEIRVACQAPACSSADRALGRSHKRARQRLLLARFTDLYFSGCWSRGLG